MKYTCITAIPWAGEHLIVQKIVCCRKGDKITIYNSNDDVLVTTQTTDARQAAGHQQFDSAATTTTVQSLEVAHDRTSSVTTASTTILAARHWLASVQTCHRQHSYRCLLSSDATTPSSVEERLRSNLSQQHIINKRP